MSFKLFATGDFIKISPTKGLAQNTLLTLVRMLSVASNRKLNYNNLAKWKFIFLT